MELIQHAVLLSSVFIGAFIAIKFKRISDQTTKLLISFSGAYLFSITVLHLIPETFNNENNLHTGLFVLIGFFLQILLEQLSKGIEHGHKHLNESIPISILVGLCIHSFIEGMPLGIHHDHHHHNHHIHSHVNNSLLSAIALHKIPVSIVLTHMLLQSNMGKAKVLMLIIFFSLTSPMGLFISHYMSNVSFYFQEISAVVIGMFLHISTTILFESSEGHRFNSRKAIAIITGAGIAIAGAFLI